ncbi:rod shape-determining protein [Amycolatopsis sp. K13G38]|uniref:Cell shape-determining protein MreB n=1 Tax=Amycolatopsis acididurans TaxID=2724524 RepID=A0ABX1J004_9PSEU|nr:rod shape-determining protein [Amycolatopsis acididurans]NKQ52314.1 rod shape-determining protein [Amycolatopsis acididurans]
MGALGIDLGNSNTVVCTGRSELVLEEPSVMLLRASRGRRVKVAAIGHDARDLVGRTSAEVTAMRPLHDGVITDLDTAQAFIRAVLRKLAPHRWQRIRTTAVIGVPLGATPLERRALLEAAEEAGLHRPVLLAEPIAGAIGCGVDPLDRRTHLVVDVGGGTAEVTAFCFGEVLAHRSSRIAGDEMTLAVYHHLRERHGILVGEIDAEDIKIRCGTAEGPTIAVAGRDAATGRPKLVTASIEEIQEAVRPVTDAIVQTLASCMDDLPPQSVGDVLAEGLLAFGGGSLLRGFHERLDEALGFSVKPAERPLTCVAEGAASALRNQSLLESFRGW